MECNREVAIKLKEIAERKLKEGNVEGARKWAGKAHERFPELEGISELLIVIDILVSAEKKCSAKKEIDWYSVLGVHPRESEETIRKRFKKLAFSINPDRNRAFGSERAFKFLTEGLSVLGDQNRRDAYDLKRTKVRRNDFQRTSVSNNDNGGRNGNAATDLQSNPVAHRPSDKTFWTECKKCLTRYEYQIVYMNKRLRCRAQNCEEIFSAVEIPKLPKKSQNGSTSKAKELLQKTDPSHCNANIGTSGPAVVGSSREVNFRLGNTEKALAGVVSNAQGAQPECEGLSRGVESEKIAAMKPGNGLAPNLVLSSSQGEGAVKKRRTDGQKKGLLLNHTANEGGRTYRESGTVPQNNVGVSGSLKPHSIRNLSVSEVKGMLMTKARMEIQKKLNEWNVEKKYSDEVDRGMKKKKMETAASNVEKCSTSGLKKDGKMNKPDEHLSTSASLDSQAQAAESVSMSVPDPEFHDFDKDRIKKSFGEGQVWAAYDDIDGMPRLYALIHEVSRPFKVKMSWLNATSNSELGPMNWVGSGFPKTCGDFWAGKHEEKHTLNIFSHKLPHWSRGKGGVIHIFPKRGDVWAIYRNWSYDWNRSTSLEIIKKYDLVQAIEDYDDEVGVRVASLIKVAGFKSVFRQQPGEVRTIPKQEMFRLSHQVVSYLITGSEGPNAPEGCLELDTAALPLELLQVISEAPHDDQTTAENAKEASTSAQPNEVKEAEER